MKRREIAHNDAGAGLIEVLVGIVIFSVVMGLLSTFTIDLIRKGAGTTNRLTNVDQLRVAMDEISKGLRIAVRPEQLNTSCTQAACAVSLYAPTATSVTFYANHGDFDPAHPDVDWARLTTYRVEPDDQRPGTGRLVAILEPKRLPEALGAASASCPAGCVSRTLVRGLTWVNGTTPVAPFTYLGASCSGLLPSQSAAVSASVACVAVDLRVDGARDNAGTSVTSTVFLPNSVIGR